MKKLGFVVALALALPGVANAAPGVNPNGMRGLGGVTQAIEIASNGMRTTRATARTYRKVGERWRVVHRAMPARLGWGGLSHAKTRVAGDGTTPIGDYGFVFDFGSRPDPGVEGFEWRHLRPGDCWSGTRAAYNRWVERRPCAPGDEDLWSNAGLAYRYAAVIDFNYEHPVFDLGSGIFLHVSHHSPTAGCVSLPERDLLGVLRWMRPGVRILIGPERWLRALKTPA
ncbi:MAG TPA: L,D-transpeptidase family protein [Solirubrobacterales bacterium]|nr:L,D-transpeptidase family protein [Solirubrobacterales bacterium]